MKQVIARMGLVLLAFAGTPLAQAQLLEKGVFFEISVGKATYKDVTTADLDGLTANFFESFELPVLQLNSSLDDTDRSYALTSGYKFNEYLSVEATYFRLGAFQYYATGRVSDQGTSLPASFFFGYRAKGVMLGGTATLPLGGYFDVRGRAGISTTDTRVKFYANVDGVPLDGKNSESSQDLYYGAGIGVRVWEYYRLGLDFTRHDKLGKAGGNGRVDADNLMLSFGYEY